MKWANTLHESTKKNSLKQINKFKKYDWAADGDWENCVRSQGAYFEGD